MAGSAQPCPPATRVLAGVLPVDLDGCLRCPQSRSATHGVGASPAGPFGE